MTIITDNKKPENLIDLIETSVSKFSERPLFGTKNKAGIYEWVTYKEIGNRIDNLRAGLAAIGIKKGDAVGLICNNRLEWPVIAFASFGLGAHLVPMYEQELFKVWKYIITDGDVKILFVSNKGIYNKVKNFINEIDSLKYIFIIDGDDEDSMISLENKGKQNPVKAIHPSPNDIATLIYTSGTTGDPKGVLLSHGNQTSNVLAGAGVFPDMNETDRSLNILPFAHVYAQVGELYYFIYIGGSIGFMENVNTILDDLSLVKPSILIAVPRIFTKIYNGIITKMNAEGGLPKKLFYMGLNSIKKKDELIQAKKFSLSNSIKLFIADKIVFKAIRKKFGGHLEGALTGSATMNAEISNFFFNIGIPVYDCYGMTETSPAITMNGPRAYKIGSVGRPVENVKVIIDKTLTGNDSPDGEIIAYGPNVMQGYYKKPDATMQIMTKDGGIKTGDRGWIDKDGFLHITGRIKEQYKLENGKYVFPSSIEEEIKLLPYIANCLVYGEGREYNICLIVPDFLLLKNYIKLPDNISVEEIVRRDDIYDFIHNQITNFLTDKYGGYEIPKKYLLLTEDFTHENGLLTQTLKLKRNFVIDKYKDQIVQLYK